ncbi:MAG: hypothetical protein ABH858_00945 [Candidatus Omnitrophota bacterium]
MADNLTFLRVSESNIDELAPGMSQLHFEARRQRRNPDYWRWRYLNCPGGKSNLTVVLRGRRVVGMYGLLYIPINLCGMPVVAGLMENVSIHSQERSWRCYRGLVEKNVVDSHEDYLAFRFGVAPRRLKELCSRIGVVSLGRVPVYFGFINFSKILNKRGFPYPLSVAGSLIDPIFGLKIKERVGKDFDIRKIDSFNSDFDGFSRSISKTRGVTVVKDSVYLNWRYRDCPDCSYVRLAAYCDHKLEGLIIFGTTGLCGDVFLVELMVGDHNRIVMRALLLQALRQMKMAKKGYVAASFTAESALTRTLKELGFKSRGTKVWSADFIVATPVDNSFSAVLDFSNWDFSLGDWLV